MSSVRFASVGTAELLPALRGDLKRARRSLIIICPWIDEYFANEVIIATDVSITVRVLMRPENSVDAAMWPHQLGAMQLLKGRFPSLAIRTLELLHAKTLVIDEEIAYVGSANFYWFSLEKSRELVIRGPIAQLGRLAAQVEELWDAGSEFSVSSEKPLPPAAGRVTQEVQDPKVLEILRKNPGAWIVGRRPK
jgi:phosphatidylserine/phosphatidylglycerophosphate/cardiolipin synthase-like enzyme